MKTTYGLPKKREQVIEALEQAFAQQNLDDTEYELRLNEAHDAKSVEDLQAVIYDFPADIRRRIFPPNHSTTAEPSHSQTPASQQDYRVFMSSPSRKIRPLQLGEQPLAFSSILGKQQADFRLTLIQAQVIHLEIECILGETVLDLRNENLHGVRLNISINGVLGTVRLLLPRGADIDQQLDLMGSELKIKDKKRGWFQRIIGQDQPQPELIGCVVTLTGSFWLGQVKIMY